MTNEQTKNQRKCIVTGEVKPLTELLRFTLTPDNALVPDFDKRLDGRGLYVCVSKKLLQKALEKRMFAKSVHKGLKISNDLEKQTEHLLYRKGLDWVNLARKAGALAAGFEKVKANILKHKVAFVIEGADASDDISQKIETADNQVEVFKVYNSEDLSAAIKTENTVYIAILKSDIAAKVYENIKRYQTFLEN